MLDTIYRDGVQRVWTEDAQSQNNYLDTIAQTRGMQAADFASLLSFFIPNDNYMLDYFDSEILQPEYGFYEEGDNLNYWNNCLVMPIYNVADKIVSVVGFNPFRYLEAKENHDWSINYYIYASSRHFRKSAHLFGAEGSYRRALRDGYLFVTDGVFDTVSLHFAGFNSLALLGSAITQEIIAMLRFIKHVLIVADNDEAGIKLSSALRKIHPNVTIVTQKFTKDIDELLNGEMRTSAISELKNAQCCSTSHYTLNVR